MVRVICFPGSVVLFSQQTLWKQLSELLSNWITKQESLKLIVPSCDLATARFSSCLSLTSWTKTLPAWLKLALTQLLRHDTVVFKKTRLDLTGYSCCLHLTDLQLIPPIKPHFMATPPLRLRCISTSGHEITKYLFVTAKWARPVGSQCGHVRQNGPAPWFTRTNPIWPHLVTYLQTSEYLWRQ